MDDGAEGDGTLEVEEVVVVIGVMPVDMRSEPATLGGDVAYEKIRAPVAAAAHTLHFFMRSMFHCFHAAADATCFVMRPRNCYDIAQENLTK